MSSVGCAYEAVGSTEDSPGPSEVVSGSVVTGKMAAGSLKASGKRGCDPLLSASLSQVCSTTDESSGSGWAGGRRAIEEPLWCGGGEVDKEWYIVVVP